MAAPMALMGAVLRESDALPFSLSSAVLAHAPAYAFASASAPPKLLSDASYFPLQYPRAPPLCALSPVHPSGPRPRPPLSDASTSSAAAPVPRDPRDLWGGGVRLPHSAPVEPFRPAPIPTRTVVATPAAAWAAVHPADAAAPPLPALPAPQGLAAIGAHPSSEVLMARVLDSDALR